MKNKGTVLKIALSFFLVVITLSSCQMAKQSRRATTLAKCDFRIVSVEKINLAGVDFQNIKALSDLAFTDMALLIGAFASPAFPLSAQVNVEGRNPNDREAGLHKLEWMLYIDDVFMTSGILDKPFVIPPKGISTIPVTIAIDLKSVLSGKSAEALIKFCLNLAGMGTEPSRFSIRLKPVILVGGNEIRYPGYITVHSSWQGN